MGNKIIISNAEYINNISNDLIYEFDIKSDGVNDVAYSEGILSFRASGPGGNYQTLGSTIFGKATIIMPIDSPVGSPAVIIGVLDDGNYAGLYLVAAGQIRKFWKDGSLNPLDLATFPTPVPTINKGDVVTITINKDSFMISYPGYSNSMLYSAIPNLQTPIIGVLGTGNGTELTEYSFVREY